MGMEVWWILLDAEKDEGEPGCYEFQEQAFRIWIEHLGPGRFVITTQTLSPHESASSTGHLKPFIQRCLDQIRRGEVRPARSIIWF
ncbi:hypothetical protein HRbin22_00122 [Candidatus Thermoflexus japonica]|uniref:Uncharacterized protein n=1 Tax=Candidatus Thermoflexus japonica TaxID=2035417 RepID=A0A2H5Y386_9CHLR|nr:hypothetical protein HRbin22_00122 [Candidatus Thermoflexus japonica]